MINYTVIQQGLRVVNETTLYTDAEDVNFAYGEFEHFMSIGEVVRYYRRKLKQIQSGRANSIRGKGKRKSS